MSKLDIRLARPDDRSDLIELQRRASLVWDDTRQQLLDQPDLIDLDSEMIAGNQVMVAEEKGRIVGFATIVTREGDDAELDGLFVEPAEWRKGVGTALVQAIEREARAWGANRLHVLANANVLGFYEAAGFQKIGEQKTHLGPIAILMVRPLTSA